MTPSDTLRSCFVKPVKNINWNVFKVFLLWCLRCNAIAVWRCCRECNHLLLKVSSDLLEIVDVTLRKWCFEFAFPTNGLFFQLVTTTTWQRIKIWQKRYFCKRKFLLLVLNGYKIYYCYGQWYRCRFKFFEQSVVFSKMILVLAAQSRYYSEDGGQAWAQA